MPACSMIPLWWMHAHRTHMYIVSFVHSTTTYNPCSWIILSTYGQHFFRVEAHKWTLHKLYCPSSLEVPPNVWIYIRLNIHKTCQSTFSWYFLNLFNICQSKAEFNQYWPEDRGQVKTYGSLLISMQSQRSTDYHTERTFHLIHKETRQERTVFQLQFTSWPEL